MCRTLSTAWRWKSATTCVASPGNNSTDAEMVGELRSGKAACEALRIERQHPCVPLVPFRDKPFVQVPLALLEIGSLHRVLHHIEQEGVVEDLEVVPIAVAGRLLVVVFVAPEELALNRRRCSCQHRQQIDPL